MKLLIGVSVWFGLVISDALSSQDPPERNSTRFNEVVVRHSDRDNLDKSLFDLHLLKYCQKPAKCEQLNYTTCMGMKLPYSFTTLELTDLITQEKVQEKLHHFQYLRYIPKCWAVIQPFLCALYMPKCENGMVDLPSREMCRITLGPCKIFYNSSIFPKFLNCDDDRIFPSMCKNDVRELKFNTTGFCMEPLVKTDNPHWFYPDVESCGLRCKDSLYTENEHYQIHKLIAYCVLFCGFFNLFTIVTFIIDWSIANKYPALTIFYMNICFFISYSGWSIQFFNSDTREDIVCKKDGTLRKSEPCATENLSCVIVFVLVYYFLIAGMVWFVLFSYTWHMSCVQALGKIQDRVDKKRAYFHLIAWSLPLILTITTMALGEIDGDFVTGICFVGSVTFAARAGLLLAPLAAAMAVAGYIIVRGLILLIKVKIDSREIISEHSSRKIRSNIVRMGVFMLFMIIFCIITFIYHGYVFVNSESWSSSLQSYILCKLTSLSSDFSHCKQESRPSVAMLQLQLLAVFGAGIAMASWVWCGATLHSWARYIRKKFRCEIEEPMKLQKHKIIAQAFAQREKFNQGGRISIECQHYTDPVGLHFDLNSAVSDTFSTAWAANLPRLVTRRGAMVDEVGYSSNNHSIDSEVSHVSVRHVSIESRCNSGDSQLSVQISELKATRKRHRSRVRRKHDFRRHSRDVRGSSRRLSKTGNKRGSSASLDSHLQLINALTNHSDVKCIEPNLNRRTGNAGLDGHHINNLLSNGKLVIPYNTNMKSGSEDENVSVTISENKYNLVLSNTNLDLSDQLVMKSLRQGLHIEELDSSTESETECGKEQEKRISRSGRNSHQSRRSKRSRTSRKQYDSNSDSFNDEHLQSDSSTCPEIRELLQ
ncbi:protein smoothened isoform X2 [Tenebrio molitor]|jgi:smoothened protein|uniref:protein smoothened isoform X2 n=1 Tax=Tenebrio molitor TaxID=7067 RepID=UPI001C3B15C8|nr:unnamed protein product [Tenebrio molitor]